MQARKTVTSSPWSAADLFLPDLVYDVWNKTEQNILPVKSSLHDTELSIILNPT